MIRAALKLFAALVVVLGIAAATPWFRPGLRGQNYGSTNAPPSPIAPAPAAIAGVSAAPVVAAAPAAIVATPAPVVAATPASSVAGLAATPPVVPPPAGQPPS